VQGAASAPSSGSSKYSVSPSKLLPITDASIVSRSSSFFAATREGGTSASAPRNRYFASHFPGLPSEAAHTYAKAAEAAMTA
jgi:hypothetical protein